MGEVGCKGEGDLGSKLHTLLSQPGDVTRMLRPLNSHCNFPLGLGNGNFLRLRRTALWGQQSMNTAAVPASRCTLARVSLPRDTESKESSL